MLNFYQIFAKILLIALALVLLIPSVLAVGIKPLRTELTLAPGSKREVTITVINPENKAITVRPEIDIYTANDEQGFPISADLPISDPKNIKSWITFDEEALTLAPRSEQEVTFTIKVPRGTEPGGRYASIVYSPLEKKGVNDRGVQIRTRVASLLLITVAGKEKISGILKEFKIKSEKIYGDQPIVFDTTFENTGNIHVKPSGVITLKNSTGVTLTGIARYIDPRTGEEVVADSIPINLGGGNVLPGSFRTFETRWNENLQTGNFTAELSLTYTDGEPLTASTKLALNPKLTVNSFDLSRGGTDQFELALTNSGNTYERLAGKIEILNNFNYKVDEITILSDTEYISPGESRTVIIPWQVREIPTGQYTAELTATYGPSKILLEAKVNFGSGGLLIWLLGGGAAVLFGGGAGWYFLGRRKPIIEKSEGSTTDFSREDGEE